MLGTPSQPGAFQLLSFFYQAPNLSKCIAFENGAAILD
jgi:hypothetical protein